MPLAAGIMAAGTIGSTIVGGLLNRSKTSTNTPTYTPQQQDMQKQVGDTLSYRLANPGDVFMPQRTQAIGQVNKAYSSIGDRLQASFAGRGFGRSGKLLTNQRQAEVSRAGDIGGLDARFAGMQTDYESDLLRQAQQYGFTSPGQSVTQPGNVAGGALSGGLSTLTTLLTLNKMLSGGGGGAPGNIYLPSGTGGWDQGG